MMAEKMWKLVMEVNLDRQRSSKKIERTIDKLQEKVKILRISYDQKNGIVTIRGRFDPEMVSKKLKDEAGKVIKSIKIEEIEMQPVAPPAPAPPMPYMDVPELNRGDRNRGTFTEPPESVGESCGCKYCCCF
ncbi:protein PYRICULARIA ORYZAE RESISTANCE 21-like [Zingiber officinale]|uniref:protein PYRICULARIA ORYZAE RESISTANCE 21-like n=1 Tax=Zingiber officinale TaxID=94328 RepID=UPI001C4CA0E8|nr:protein PYRICULARIA ORYZAE RESISTANCE 21-like [Zingiber officinale]